MSTEEGNHYRALELNPDAILYDKGLEAGPEEQKRTLKTGRGA